jgi:flagellar biosynthesis component FlhA
MLDLIIGLILKILGIFFIILVLMIVISFLLIFFIFLLFFGLMEAFYYIIDKHFESRLLNHDSIKKTKQKIINVFGKKNNLDNQDDIEKTVSQGSYESTAPLKVSVGVPICSLEISKNLLPLVDEAQGKELIRKIPEIKEEIIQELGLIIPPVQIEDNIDIEPNMCIIKIKGVKILEIKVYLDKIIAIGPLNVIKQLNGIPGRYPIYDLSAAWIDQGEENLAQRLECIIFKPIDFIAYHLKRIIKDNAHKLLDPNSGKY